MRLIVRTSTAAVDGFGVLLAWWLRMFTMGGALAFLGACFLILLALALAG